MQYLLTKQVRNFKQAERLELPIQTCKVIVKNQLLPFAVRQLALQVVNNEFPLQAHISYLKPRCMFSNRSNSVLTSFKINRVRFKTLAAYAGLPGIQKASW